MGLFISMCMSFDMFNELRDGDLLRLESACLYEILYNYEYLVVCKLFYMAHSCVAWLIPH